MFEFILNNKFNFENGTPQIVENENVSLFKSNNPSSIPS